MKNEPAKANNPKPRPQIRKLLAYFVFWKLNRQTGSTSTGMRMHNSPSFLLIVGTATIPNIVPTKRSAAAIANTLVTISNALNG